jgi:hypothetical protein
LAQALPPTHGGTAVAAELHRKTGKSMGTFFDRKQLMVSVVLLGILELTVVVARALAH